MWRGHFQPAPKKPIANSDLGPVESPCRSPLSAIYDRRAETTLTYSTTFAYILLINLGKFLHLISVSLQQLPTTYDIS
ncbi:hypothetical protein [Microcoleus sp. B4-C5]|uniref:hypothetical protein n=1 Tax=Microcoleus sp. B4-C5 TaxID=2818664 RepID=UPI002FD2E315